MQIGERIHIGLDSGAGEVRHHLVFKRHEGTHFRFLVPSYRVTFVERHGEAAGHNLGLSALVIGKLQLALQRRVFVRIEDLIAEDRLELQLNALLRSDVRHFDFRGKVHEILDAEAELHLRIGLVGVVDDHDLPQRMRFVMLVCGREYFAQLDLVDFAAFGAEGAQQLPFTVENLDAVVARVRDKNPASLINSNAGRRFELPGPVPFGAPGMNDARSGPER